jgi:transposase
VTAWGLLAEIGLDSSQFPDAQPLASWAGLCPGRHESAGQRKSGKIRQGSLWLRGCLCQGAWAISTKKNHYLSARYRRLAARRGSKRARIAVAHNLLVIAYYILRDKTCYQDLGPAKEALAAKCGRMTAHSESLGRPNAWTGRAESSGAAGH